MHNENDSLNIDVFRNRKKAKKKIINSISFTSCPKKIELMQTNEGFAKRKQHFARNKNISNK